MDTNEIANRNKELREEILDPDFIDQVEEWERRAAAGESAGLMAEIASAFGKVQGVRKAMKRQRELGESRAFSDYFENHKVTAARELARQGFALDNPSFEDEMEMVNTLYFRLQRLWQALGGREASDA